jgi:hypothetical protein
MSAQILNYKRHRYITLYGAKDVSTGRISWIVESVRLNGGTGELVEFASFVDASVYATERADAEGIPLVNEVAEQIAGGCS